MAVELHLHSTQWVRTLTSYPLAAELGEGGLSSRTGCYLLTRWGIPCWPRCSYFRLKGYCCLNEMSPKMPHNGCLTICFPVAGARGSMSVEAGFRSLKTHAILNSLSLFCACCSRCEPSASSSRQHAFACPHRL